MTLPTKEVSMTATGAEPLAPIDLVNKILVSDPAILGVIAIDEKGNNIAVAIKGEIPEKGELTEEFVKRGAQVLAIVKGIVSQYETLYGRFQSIVMNFETAKVVILSVPEIRIALALRLIRSSNVDYVTTSVLALLGIVGKTERIQIHGVRFEPIPSVGPSFAVGAKHETETDIDRRAQ